jgi:hypothetical protein
MILGHVARKGLKPRWTARELAATRVVDGERPLIIRRTHSAGCSCVGVVSLEDLEPGDHVVGPFVERWRN